MKKIKTDLIKKFIDKSKSTHLFKEWSFDIETSKLKDKDGNKLYEDHFVPISCSLASINNEAVWYHNKVIDKNKVFEDAFETIIENSPKLKKGSIIVWVHNLSYEATFLVKNFLKKYENDYIAMSDSFNQQFVDKVRKNKNKDFIKPDGNFYELIHIIKENNTFYNITITYKGRVITFKDSYKFISRSLSSITNDFVKTNLDVFKFLKKKDDTNYDYNAYRHLGDSYSESDIEYTINDVLAVNAIIYLMKSQCGDNLGLTLAGTSYKMMCESMHDGIITADNSKLFMLILNKMAYFDKEIIQVKNIKNLYKVESNNNEYIIRFRDYIDKFSGDIIINKENVNIEYFYSLNGIKEIISYIKKDLSKDKINQLSKNIQNNTFIQFFENEYIQKNNLTYIEKFFDIYTAQVVMIEEKETKRIWKEIKKTGTFLANEQCDFELDSKIRESYRGGITQLNPIFQYRKIDNVWELDLNSSYPSILSQKVPYKIADYNENGDLNYNKNTQVKLMKVKISYKINYGYPSLFANKNFMNSSCNFRYRDENAIEYLWQEEFEVLKRISYITKFNVLESWVFDISSDLYSNYVNKYYKFKSTMKDISPLIYQASKLLLNSPYGKLGENLYRENETITSFNFNDQGEFIIKHEDNPDYNPEEINGRPIFTAAYITAMGRCKLLNGICDVIDAGGQYLYCDTDSVFFSCKEFKIRKSDHIALINNNECKSLKVDKTILGEWDLEIGILDHEDDEYKYYNGEKSAKYLNPKRYQIYTRNGETKTKAAGFTKESQKTMNESNFEFGNTFISRQKVSTIYGTDIIDKQKIMSYPEFLYLVTNINRNTKETLSSKYLFDIKDQVVDVYGELCSIESILYNPNVNK